MRPAFAQALPAFLLVAPLLIALSCPIPFAFAGSGGGEDADLGLIPDEALSVPRSDAPDTGTGANLEEKPKAIRIKMFLDEALQSSFERGSLAVPLPESGFAGWNNRISLDVRAEAFLSSTVLLTLADRVNHISNEDMDLSEDGLQNDLKEAYLAWNFHGSHYLDLGRVNVKNGAAIGFNPTDYFKKNAVTTRISEDPSILRENRLGVLMARAQGVWEKGALALAIAPEVPDDAGRWWTDGTGGLELGRTNSTTRFLAKANVNAFRDLNPEVLYLYDDGRSSCGLNLTGVAGNSIVAYAEWSIGQSPDIISDSLQDARSAGIIPSNVPSVIPGDGEIRFRNQLAVGFSYTEKVKRTTYFEYHYNEAGFSRGDWENWFDAGARAKGLLGNPATEAAGQERLGELWAIRKGAQDAQEPLSRHSFLVRSTWQDVFNEKLDLTGIFLINLYDGSFFLQPLAEYHLSSSLTLSLTLNFFLGSAKSEFGSLQELGNARVGVTYYF